MFGGANGVTSVWCKQCGAVDVVQWTWCNLCGAIYFPQSIWTEPPDRLPHPDDGRRRGGDGAATVST
eukprot:845217-Pyramimonas_sp.AAC.1